MNCSKLQTNFLSLLTWLVCLNIVLARPTYSQKKTEAIFASKRITSFSAMSNLVSDSGNENWDGRFHHLNSLYGTVVAVLTINEDIFIGGDLGRKSIAKWNGDGWWSTLGGGFDAGGGPSAFAVIGNDLYVGGSFTMVGGIAANNIAKWNLAIQKWSAVESGRYNGVSHEVAALAVDGDNLYVGGSFTTAGHIRANQPSARA